MASNSYLSANAGADILKAGGNAIDAAIAATLVEGLVNPQMNTLGGECPVLVRLAGESRVIALNGNMAAPMAATPESFYARGYDDVPDVRRCDVELARRARAVRIPDVSLLRDAASSRLGRVLVGLRRGGDGSGRARDIGQRGRGLGGLAWRAERMRSQSSRMAPWPPRARVT